MEHRFNVHDMTCGHCVERITKAIRAVDSDTKLAVDLSSHVVVIDGGESRALYEDAIRSAGYTPAQ